MADYQAGAHVDTAEGIDLGMTEPDLVIGASDGAIRVVGELKTTWHGNWVCTLQETLHW
jgi:hypothetical protein